jgi:hypothetical protein
MANPFFTALNSATLAVAAMCAESFSVVRNGTPGTYAAVSIDEIDATSASAMSGGKFAEVSVRLYVTYDVLAAAKIGPETVLEVRGVRVRVKNDPIKSNDGDNTATLECGPVGIHLK